MGTNQHLIDVPTFEEAVQFIKNRAAAQGLKLINEQMTDDGWYYNVEQPPNPDHIVLACFSHIPREPISILR